MFPFTVMDKIVDTIIWKNIMFEKLPGVEFRKPGVALSLKNGDSRNESFNSLDLSSLM